MELETAPVVDVEVNTAALKKLFGPAIDGLLGNSASPETANEKLLKAVEAMRGMNAEMRMALVEQAQQFEAFVKNHKKLVVAHHIDADGLTSAVLLTALYAEVHNTSIEEASNAIEFFSINNGNRNFEEDQLVNVRTLRAAGYTGLIIADLSPRDTQQLEELADMGYQLANIDHHGVGFQKQPFACRYNPESIDAFPQDVLAQMSTSTLFGMYPALSKYTWLMKLGNKGDESQMFDLILSSKDEEKENEEINVLEELANENFSMYALARFLNVIGSTEQFGVSASQRDEFIRWLLSEFFSQNLEQRSAVYKLNRALRSNSEYIERFDRTNGSMFKTVESLLGAAEVAAQRANEKYMQSQSQSEIVQVHIEGSKPILVIEGEGYRILVHEIDNQQVTAGNIIIGNVIKAHLNQLDKQAQSRRMLTNDIVVKWTTAIVLQKRTDQITEMGLYTSDFRLYDSVHSNCEALLKATNKMGLTEGAGGHRERGGGDIPSDKVSETVWHLVEEITTHLDAGRTVPRWEYGIDGAQVIREFLE